MVQIGEKINKTRRTFECRFRREMTIFGWEMWGNLQKMREKITQFDKKFKKKIFFN